MRPNDEELKAEMMAAAEEAIEKLLAGTEEKEDLSLGDIERLVRRAGQDVMKELTGTLANAEAQDRERHICPECGRKMRYKGRKKREVITETGEVTLERGYYFCPSCRKGVFPPGPTVGAERDGV
jgi:ssDNA-binding Zn-finger/Zn-ribbon topoisomerase 1